MFCIKCGTALPDGTNFCPKCGNPSPSQAQAAFSAVPVIPPKPKTFNIFALISAGISATLLLLCFVPWVTAGGKGFSMPDFFTRLLEIHEFGGFPFVFCSIIMIVCAGLLIASLALLLTKNSMEKGFVIATSAGYCEYYFYRPFKKNKINQKTPQTFRLKSAVFALQYIG